VDNVRRLQPLRVLVTGSDRPFVRVTAFLLSLRGYEIDEAEPGEATSAAQRHRADVVLLEAGDSRAEAATRVAQFSCLPAAPTVVVVTESGETPWPGQAAVPKWMPVDDLVRAIESVSLQREFPIAEEA
jgi:CheY-like chemotaxis protein